MADSGIKRNIPIKLGDFSVIDTEFSNIRERFDAEMRKMEDEMSRFRSELMNRESNNFFKSTTRYVATGVTAETHLTFLRARTYPPRLPFRLAFQTHHIRFSFQLFSIYIFNVLSIRSSLLSFQIPLVNYRQPVIGVSIFNSYRPIAYQNQRFVTKEILYFDLNITGLYQLIYTLAFSIIFHLFFQSVTYQKFIAKFLDTIGHSPIAC